MLSNIHVDDWPTASTTFYGFYTDNGLYTYDYSLAYSPTRTMAFGSPWTTQAHKWENETRCS